MERSYKRQRLADPPEFDLLYRREKNDRRLKSTFEAIFDKYGKDFEGIGDEIDLETGEIVVNNGHVVGMLNERDPGDLEVESEYDSEAWSDGEEILASSLLLETGRRLGALEYAESLRRPGYVDDEGDEEVDSLMGDNDSLLGESERGMSLPPTNETSIPPDSFHDDDSEDGENGSELEWPTPRKMWSTPRKSRLTPRIRTPLSRTSWHTSPAKHSRHQLPPIDPMWKAPPLPIRRLRKPAHPATFPPKQKVQDFGQETRTHKSSPRNWGQAVKLPSSEHHVSKSPSLHFVPSKASSLEARPRKPPSPTAPGSGPRDLSTALHSQVSQNTATGETRPNCSRRLSRIRWTKEDDRLLIRLKTTTELSYSEIAPYFPGRGFPAIKTRWSYMTRMPEYQSEIHGSPEPENAVVSTAPGSPPLYETIESDMDADPASYMTSTELQGVTNHLNDKVDVQTSGSPIPAPSAPSLSSKSQEVPLRCGQVTLSEIGQTRARGYSLYYYEGSQQAVSTPSHRDASIPVVVKDEEEEVDLFQRQASSSKAETMSSTRAVQPVPVSKSPSSSPPLQPDRMSQGEPKKFVGSSPKHLVKNTPRASLPVNQAPRSKQLSSSASKDPVYLPSHLSDDSDDELSTPVRTIGSDKVKVRQVSTTMLSDMVHQQISSAASRY